MALDTGLVHDNSTHRKGGDRMESHSRRLSLADQMEDNPQMDEHDNNMTAQKQGGWTPGPWTASKPDDTYFDDWNVVRADGLAVAAVVQNGDIDPLTVQANARLIAAAPNLLAIATRILERGYISSSIEEERDDHHALVAALSRANPSTDQGEG